MDTLKLLFASFVLAENDIKQATSSRHSLALTLASTLCFKEIHKKQCRSQLEDNARIYVPKPVHTLIRSRKQLRWSKWRFQTWQTLVYLHPNPSCSMNPTTLKTCFRQSVYIPDSFRRVGRAPANHKHFYARLWLSIVRCRAYLFWYKFLCIT